MPILIWLSAFAIGLLALFGVALWHHKKSAERPLNLCGAAGIVESTLDPEGAVIIDGELWRARAADGNDLKTRDHVRVIGMQAHLLMVAATSDVP